MSRELTANRNVNRLSDVSRALAPLHQLINAAEHLNWPSERELAEALGGHSAADMTVGQLLDLIQGLR